MLRQIVLAALDTARRVGMIFSHVLECFCGVGEIPKANQSTGTKEGAKVVMTAIEFMDYCAVRIFDTAFKIVARHVAFPQVRIIGFLVSTCPSLR